MMNQQNNRSGQNWSARPRPPGPVPPPPSAWSSSSSSASASVNNSSKNMPEVNMLMDQVRQLQQKVQELSQNQGSNPVSGSAGGDGSGFEYPTDQRILLVSNVPNSLASCDALFFMFERFGVVERIKILHNKRSAALVQMQTPDMAEHAVNEQHVLNRIGADIYVNFSNKVSEIRMPSEKGLPEDGLSKDFTYANQGPFFGPNGNGGGPFSGAGPRGPPMPVPPMPPMPPLGHDNGVCILVSCLPDEMANPDSISNLFGHYGDVHKVKILHNKPDCALIQMAKPHHAALCRQFLDQIKVAGNTLCVSFSRMQNIRMPNEIGIDGEQATKDFTNVKGVHRFRNHNIAAKLSKNLCSPTSVLHVANLPDTFKCADLRNYLIEKGFTVTEVEECGKDGNMGLVQMASIEEAIRALAKLHNVTPEGHQTKNNSGLCFSFSGRKTGKDKSNDA